VPHVVRNTVLLVTAGGGYELTGSRADERVTVR
jgi:hypothetical protein